MKKLLLFSLIVLSTGIINRSSGQSPLPVQFKSFIATRTYSNVLLKWEVIWEQNSAGFGVERNINGYWEEIGYVNTLAANGNSSQLLTYQFTDINNHRGVSQYRIRQMDRDNRAKFSEIRMVRAEDQNGQVIAYPNPSFDGKINLSFENTALKNIQLTDMSGRIVKQVRSVNGNSLTMEDIPAGIFNLQVIDPGTSKQTVVKIVVNKE